MLKNHNAPVKPSMGRKGDCWDNAVSGSFYESLKVEKVYEYSYGLKLEAELFVFRWIETWYNRRRTHSTLGFKTIEESELEIYNQKTEA